MRLSGSPRALATDFLPLLTIKARESFAAWARFPALLADVEKITVVITRMPPFEDFGIAK